VSSVSKPDEVLVYERRTRELVPERVLGDALLRLAYLGPLRGPCRFLLFRRTLPSRLLGWYCDTRRSRRKIPRVIEALDLDVSEFRDPASSFRTFNEFFCRHLRDGARPFDRDPGALCSPADARLSVFPRLEADACVPVKGASFTLTDLLGAPAGDVAKFANGVVVVARLCPADYHRFHYPAAGRELRNWEIPGRLDSVNPVVLALGFEVFTHNRRIVSLLDLAGFGETAFVEVGAFGVGGIVRTHEGPEFGKMDEKGCFKFGGSTIILVFQSGRLEVDPDLVENTRTGHETRVRAGETIGRLADA